MRTALKKILAVMLAAALVCAAATGCQKKVETNYTTNPTILLNGYEDLKELNSVNLFEGLGKMELSDEHVTEGNKSAKVTVTDDPWYFNFGIPYFKQATEILRGERDFSDFGRIGMITLDVFSVSPGTRIALQLVYRYNSNKATGRYEPIGDTPTWQELHEGANVVNFNIAADSIPEVEENGAQIRKVVALNFYFDRPTDGDNVFFIDNLRLHNSQSPQQSDERFMKENEICSFDYVWQYKLLTPEVGNAGTDYSPKLVWQNEITSPKADGGAAIKVDAAGIRWPNAYSNYFVGLNVGKDIFNYFPHTEDDYTENDKFCFDIYTPDNNGAVMLTFYFYSNSTAFFVQQACIGVDGVPPLKRGWNYFEYTVAELNAGIRATDNVNFYTMNRFCVVMRTDDTPEGVFYVDNIRMEKGPAPEEED